MSGTWTRTSAGNEVLERDGFFVSFRRDTASLGKAWQGDDHGAGETALYNEANRFLILNGDFRAEYEEAAPRGYDACRAVYEAHRRSCRSAWSDDEARTHCE